jgi:hypothetical protein
MSSILQGDYDLVALHLQQAHAAMRRFMAISGDWATKGQVEEEFRSLRDSCRDFAMHQYGITIRRRKRGDREGPPHQGS